MSQALKTILAATAAVVFTSAVLAQEPAPAAAHAPSKVAQIFKSIFQKMDRNSDGKVTPAEHQERVKEWLKEMDKNGDGKLTPDEFTGQRFVEMDINKDGSITLEEYLVFFVGSDILAKAGETAPADTLYPKNAQEITGVEVVAYRKAYFKATNTSGSGKLTPEEVKAYSDKEFKFLDKNNDGLVTEDEITAFVVIPVLAPKTAAKPAATPAEK